MNVACFNLRQVGEGCKKMPGQPCIGFKGPFDVKWIGLWRARWAFALSAATEPLSHPPSVTWVVHHGFSSFLYFEKTVQGCRSLAAAFTTQSCNLAWKYTLLLLCSPIAGTFPASSHFLEGKMQQQQDDAKQEMNAQVGVVVCGFHSGV